MLCRLKVSKFVSGGEVKYDAKDKGLLTVFDMGLYNKLISESKKPMSDADREAIGHKCYRSINLEAIVKLRLDDVVYEVGSESTDRWQISYTNDIGATVTLTVTGRDEDEAWTSFKRQTGLTRKPAKALITRVS